MHAFLVWSTTCSTICCGSENPWKSTPRTSLPWRSKKKQDGSSKQVFLDIAVEMIGSLTSPTRSRFFKCCVCLWRVVLVFWSMVASGSQWRSYFAIPWLLWRSRMTVGSPSSCWGRIAGRTSPFPWLWPSKLSLRLSLSSVDRSSYKMTFRLCDGQYIRATLEVRQETSPSSVCSKPVRSYLERVGLRIFRKPHIPTRYSTTGPVSFKCLQRIMRNCLRCHNRRSWWKFPVRSVLT